MYTYVAQIQVQNTYKPDIIPKPLLQKKSNNKQANKNKIFLMLHSIIIDYYLTCRVNSVFCGVPLLWKCLFDIAFGHEPPNNGQDCRRQEGSNESSHLIRLNSSGDKSDVYVKG